jgi:arginyl-tRNA synthetase
LEKQNLNLGNKIIVNKAKLTYERLYTEVKRMLKEVLPDEEEFYLEKPLLEEHGDVATTIAFKLSKKLKKNPLEIANDIYSKLLQIQEKYPLIKEIKVINGYINFYANEKLLTKIVIEEIQTKKKDYGKTNLGNGKKVLIEHTNTNPNKAIHIGHSRNTCLGDALSRILKFVNYNVYTLNYIDDTGSQMADLMLGFTKLKFPLESEIRFDKYCGDHVYVKVNELYETNKELLDEKQKLVKEIDSQTTEIAKMTREVARRVLYYQLKTCLRLGAYFDLINWESDIVRFELLKQALQILEKNEIITKETEGPNKGCIVIKSKLIKGHEKETDQVIIRADGSSTYLAKDIAYAFWKLGIIKDEFKYRFNKEYPIQCYETDVNGTDEIKFGGADLAISVIDVRQTRLQDVIKSVIYRVAGEEMAKRYIHYKYELVALSNKAAKELGYQTESKIVHMSGRKGIYFNTDDVLDKLKDKIKEIVKKNNPDKDEKWIDETSEKIAVSALRYALLKLDSDKVLVFDFDETLKLEGDSGVYVLYTYVRTKGILRKAKEIKRENYESYLPNDMEIKIIKKLAWFTEAVKIAAQNLQPQTIIVYIRDLCDLFNSYYEKYPVINSNEPARSFRINLVECVSQVLENAMNLVGLIPVEYL